MSVCSLTMRPCLDSRCGMGRCYNGGYYASICPVCLGLDIPEIGCDCEEEDADDRR